MDWPQVGKTLLRAAEFLCEFANVEPIHLEFQRAEWDAKVARSCRDVPSRFFERAQDEIALERVRRLLKQALAVRGYPVKLREMEFERQVFVRYPFLVADRHEPLDEILELSDVARPPVT